MANSTIPGLVAVSVPALTDLLGVRQSGDSRDKKLTVTQLLSLAPGGGDVTKVGTPVDNQVGVWTGDGTLEGDTDLIWDGVTLSLNQLVIGGAAGTIRMFSGAANAMTFRMSGTSRYQMDNTSFRTSSSTGGGLAIGPPSGTVPTLTPANGDANTGIGRFASDTLSLISGGVEMLRLQEVPGATQSIFSPAGAQNDAGNPTIAFGNADTGFFEVSDNVLAVSVGGVAQWVYSSDEFRGNETRGPQMISVAAAATTPVFTFQSDNDTGIGSAALNQVSIIGGGAELARFAAAGVTSFIAGGTDPAADGGDLDLSSGDSGVAATGDGGAVNILAGESLATAGDGGVVSIKSGAGILSGAGGDILVEVGTGGAAGPGTSGRFFVNTLTGANAAAGLQVPLPGLTAIYGVGRSGAGLAGNLELWGGYASGAGGGSIGGNLMLFGGGQGGGSGEGGNAILVGGESDTQPGDARMVGGVATSAGIGGAATVTGGAAAGVNNSGGSVQVTGGLGIGTGTGGQANLIGGGSGSGATGNGGNAEVVGGASNATAGDGGAVTIQSGAGNGAGVDGDINFKIGSATEFFISDAPNADFQSLDGGGPAIRNRPTSGTVPTLVPNRADLDTGIGSAQVDNLSLIAGGVQGLRLAEASGGIIFQPDADLAITAFATGGQGSATQLDSSHSVITTVATTGDSVKLPPVFNVNSVMFIKNDGVNAADVFPATGDDLGAGLNTAVSLAAGESASFIATVANATWTPWIVSVGGGGGDVTKVGTPVDNQIGVWTGDGTIEGTTAFVQNANSIDTTLRYRTAFGSSGSPAHSFTGETNSGLFRQSSGVLMMSLLGTGSWVFRGTSFDANIANGPRLMFEAASATNPVFIPRLADTDTGIGAAGDDQLDLIAGGLSCMSVRETAAARQIGFYTTAPISQQTGVAVTDVAIHAALVALGLITA